ncbi:hypothetical protein LTR86_003637 [Recurvomyces mirabilis]|nr:hypothetical protein LTR86_003637 [Recurvomyces mirabilis]
MATPSCGAQPTSAHQQASLLRLPAEIRNRIYEDFFNSITTIHIGVNVNSRDIALVQVCKQTRHEALSLMYATCGIALNIKPIHVDRTIAWLQAQPTSYFGKVPYLVLVLDSSIIMTKEQKAVLSVASLQGHQNMSLQQKAKFRLVGRKFVRALVAIGIAVDRVTLPAWRKDDATRVEAEPSEMMFEGMRSRLKYGTERPAR